jgi:hypothetical protein
LLDYSREKADGCLMFLNICEKATEIDTLIRYGKDTLKMTKEQGLTFHN